MKISYNWLKTLVNIQIPVSETADLLTASGLEVEGTEITETIQGGLNGLVVGHILECVKHPDADRLKITKVDIGAAEPLSIVCGAPNAAAGQKVIVAKVGTKLYPTTGEPFEIKKSKIRGVLSEGMICAEDEFGLGESHEGIMVLPEDTEIGQAAAEYFKLENDTVLEIGLTPNRSDATSHMGVARDLVAILNSANNDSQYQISLQGLQELPEASEISTVKISVENESACKRYSGLVISGITIKESPDWLKQRLKSIGLRPINNVVDVTNFVMHELGQPLHAFDLEKIKGGQITVKHSKDGEQFKTLDGTLRSLTGNELMIYDAESPLCIAGVFGGFDSGVSINTKAIFLESAFFDAAAVRKSSKIHSLKTDASFRFERGTDPDMTVTALVRATNLIFELAGGTLSMGITDVYPEKIEPYKVAFSYSNCTELIGKEIERQQIKNIILNLGITIESEGSDGLLLLVPRFKTDVTREVDVIEEVMRIYGYNKVAVSKLISYTAFNEEQNFDVLLENKASALLEGFGFNETMSLSLSKESYYDNNLALVKMLNPLSADLSVLRADMLFSGLEAISHNINRRNTDLKLFEIGKTYHTSGATDLPYHEKKHISIFVSGKLFPENAQELNHNVDFFFLKTVLVNLFEKCGLNTIKSVESNYQHFDFGLSYSLNGKIIAEAGAVSQLQLNKFDISQPVFYACINWEVLVKAFSKNKIQFEELSKFPSVKRDLALLLDKNIKYQEVETLALSLEKKYLKDVNLFDIYEGEKLGNKKSYGIRFTLMDHEATLTDKQIENVMQKLMTGYKEKLGAEIR